MEDKQIRLAKMILESNGYEVSDTLILYRAFNSLHEREEVLNHGYHLNRDGDSTPSYYLISVDASTNAPGTTYYGRERVQKGEEILKSAGISDTNVEAATLGYDDVSFIVTSSDKKYVDRIARKIAAYAEEPSDQYRQEYDLPGDVVVAVSGPYDNEDFDFGENTDSWYR